MKVTNGVEMLEIPCNIMGTSGIINPTLIWDKGAVILVDTGFPGQLLQFRQAIDKTGVPFDKLNMVILTHQDIDHIGSLPGILKEVPDGINVLAHEIEKPYIQGDKTPVKVAKLEAKLEMLPKEMKELYEKLKAGFQSCKTKVDIVLTDGEELPYCGGITVIHTPGHTPGHICLYLKQSRILIAGDMFGVEGGVLVPSPKEINYDNDMNKKSLEKLVGYDIQTVICYHGGIYEDNVNQRIKELADKYI